MRTILLEGVERVLPANDFRRRKWYDSATHQEIRHGAMEADNAREHVFCYFREIKDLPEDGSVAEYCDIRGGAVDTEAQDRLKRLKTNLENHLPREHVHPYAVAWQDGRPAWGTLELEQFCGDVKRDLKRVIDQEVETFRNRRETDREVEAQQEFAQDRSRHFVGREDILRRINEYLASDDNRPLIICGKSGSGKTALMAQAWLSIPDERQAVARFIGATPASCDLRSLLSGLCRQMGIVEVPSDMNELVKAFRERMSPPGQGESRAEGQAAPQDRPPVMLFLDALDQLNATDNARMLYWLPRELAPGVKLVLSVLQTEKPAEQASRQTEPAKAIAKEYDCYDLAGRIWPGRLAELGGLEGALAAGLLETWLAEAGRTLQLPQREHILAEFSHCPLPLYLKLAFGEARRWKSWDELPHRPGAPVGLSDTDRGHP